MSTDEVLLSTLQSSGLFLIVWATFRLMPWIPANAKAWTWRFALLKPLIGMLPLAVFSLHVLPPSTPTLVERTSTFTSTESVSQKSAVPAFSSPHPNENVSSLLLVPWFLGTTIIGGKGVIERRRARKIARFAEPVSCKVVQRFLHELLARASKGIAVPPVQLLASSEAKTAMLVGGRRPAIVLPKTILEAPSLCDARLMIAHELAHLCRRDLGWFGFAWIIQAIFFFNPFVWLAVRASQEAHESATDCYAIDLAEISTTRYAEMLVHALISVRPSPVPGAAFMSGSYRSIHRRLEAMKHFRFPFNPQRKAVFGAFALTVTCLMPAYRLAQASPPLGRPNQRNSAGTGQESGVGASYWLAPVDPSNPGNISCAFNNYDVRQALAKVFQRQDRAFRIDPQVKGTVTLELHNVSLAGVLTNITRQVGAGYSIEKNTFLIANRSQTPPSANPLTRTSHEIPVTFKEVKVSLDFDKMDAREVLRQLFRLAPDRSYTIAPNLQGIITISLKDVGFEAALQNVLRQVGGTFQLNDGVYVITSAEKPPTR